MAFMAKQENYKFYVYAYLRQNGTPYNNLTAKVPQGEIYGNS